MPRPQLLLFLTCCAASLAGPAIAQQPIECGKMASVEQVDRALAQRGVEIVRIARSGDPAPLAALVAPGAEFTLTDRDVILPSAEGPAGAVKFAQALQPQSFDFAVTESGPSLAQICGKHVETVRFATASGTYYVVEFSFDRGLLIRATGSAATVSKDDMGASGG